MESKILGIFSYPWSEEYKRVPLQEGNLLTRYNKMVWFKANPRNEDYMKQLFFKCCTDGDYVNADKDPEWYKRIASADQLILLYPDSIGLGFRQIESQAFRFKQPWVSVHVINGRKRKFLLTGSTLRRLYLRRFLERWMIGEMMATLFFLILTPILALLDWMRNADES